MNATDPTKTLGFGIVGVGSIAHTHALAIQALAASHNVKLVGVLGRSEASTQQFADKHGIPFWSTDAAAFFARPDIDVVCVVTPSGAHLEPTLAAIAAGKHLVIEKPLEISVARVDAMLKAAADAGVKLAGIFQARLAAGSQTVKRALDAGRFGRLSLCSAYVKWHRSDAYYQGWKGTLALDGGGAVINQAIHAVDLLQWFAGMPAEVFAFKTRCVHQKIEAEDTACAAFRFRHGALGTLEATTAAWPGWARRIELCGEFGSVALEDEKIVRWEFRDQQPGDDTMIAAAGSASSGASSPEVAFAGHQAQIADLVEALRSGAPLMVDGPQARNSVEIVCAIYESAQTGLPVRLG